MKRFWIVLALFGMCASLVQAGMEAGRREIQVQGSLSSQGMDSESGDDGEDTLTMTGNLILNYYTSPNMSVGLNAVIMGSESEGTTVTALFMLGRVDLYLGDGSSAAVPYVGGRAGFVNYSVTTDDGSYDDSSTTLTYGGQGGFKIFNSENTSWNIEGSYTVWVPEQEDSSEEITFHEMALSVGFSYYF